MNTLPLKDLLPEYNQKADRLLMREFNIALKDKQEKEQNLREKLPHYNKDEPTPEEIVKEVKTKLKITLLGPNSFELRQKLYQDLINNSAFVSYEGELGEYDMNDFNKIERVASDIEQTLTLKHLRLMSDDESINLSNPAYHYFKKSIIVAIQDTIYYLKQEVKEAAAVA